MTQGKAHSQNFKCFHESHALNPCLGKTKSNIIGLNQTVVHHTSETKNRLQVNYRWTYKRQVLKYTVKDRKGWSRTRKVGSPWGVRDQSLLGRREAGHPTVPPEKGQCWNLSWMPGCSSVQKGKQRLKGNPNGAFGYVLSYILHIFTHSKGKSSHRAILKTWWKYPRKSCVRHQSLCSVKRTWCNFSFSLSD